MKGTKHPHIKTKTTRGMLRLYDTKMRQLLGSTPRSGKQWRWTPAGALLLGIAQPQVEAQPGQPAVAVTCTGNTVGDSTASTATLAAAMEVSARLGAPAPGETRDPLPHARLVAHS